MFVDRRSLWKRCAGIGTMLVCATSLTYCSDSLSERAKVSSESEDGGDPEEDLSVSSAVPMALLDSEFLASIKTHSVPFANGQRFKADLAPDISHAPGTAMTELGVFLTEYSSFAETFFGRNGYFTQNPLYIKKGQSKLLKRDKAPHYIRVTRVDDPNAEHIAVEPYTVVEGQAMRMTVYEYIAHYKNGEPENARIHLLNYIPGQTRLNAAGSEVDVTLMVRLNADTSTGIMTAEMGDAPVTFPMDTLLQLQLSNGSLKVAGAYKYISEKDVDLQDRSQEGDVGIFRMINQDDTIAQEVGLIPKNQWSNARSIGDIFSSFKPDDPAKQGVLTPTGEQVAQNIATSLAGTEFVVNSPVAAEKIKFHQGGYTFENLQQLTWPALEALSVSCLNNEVETGERCRE